MEPLTYQLQTFPTRTEGSVKKHWYKVCELKQTLKPMIVSH